MSTGMRSRAATAALTVSMAVALGLGVTTAAYGAGQGPCYDGRCDITVSKPMTIKVNGNRFGFANLKVTHTGPDVVKVSAAVTGGGAHLGGSAGAGGLVRLNNLDIYVNSISGHKAELSLYPAS